MEKRRVKVQSKNYFNSKHEASFDGLGKRATKTKWKDDPFYLYGMNLCVYKMIGHI